MEILKYKINSNVFTASTDTVSINIPISLKMLPVDNSELINSQFIPTEVEKVINAPVDNEKVRFIPIDSLNNVQKNIVYNVIFGGNNPSYYSSVGFIDDDLKYRKNNLKNTFLRLVFYDSPVSTNQDFLFLITPYTNIKDPTQSVSNVPIMFNLNNTTEGYNLYYFKSKVLLSNPPLELYMSADFNNAKTGIRTRLCTVDTPLNITNVADNTYVKYLLSQTISGSYYYTLDPLYSSNFTYNNSTNQLMVNLYEMKVS